MEALSSYVSRREEEDDGFFLFFFKPLGFCFVTVNEELGSSSCLLGQCRMRSPVGLIFVVVVATLYLYCLSLYLPAGPRRLVPKGKHVDTGQPGDTSGEPIR